MKYEDLFLNAQGIPCNLSGVLFDTPPQTWRRSDKIRGVGQNDYPFSIKKLVDNKTHIWKPYQMWGSMLVRAYSPLYKSRNPTYANVQVCDEWLRFTTFWGWLRCQHFVEDAQLDKDILSDSKIYSPNTCVIVPKWVNSFILSNGGLRGDTLIGVHKKQPSGKYSASICNPISGLQVNLGTYAQEIDAHLAWRSAKLDFCLELKSKFDEVDERLYPSIVRKIENMR